MNDYQANAELNHAIRTRLENLGNRFATVEFVKANGELRRMTLQRAVEKKHIVGSERGEKAAATRAISSPDIVPMYSIADKGWRSVNLNRVLAVTANGVRIDYRKAASLPHISAT